MGKRGQWPLEDVVERLRSEGAAANSERIKILEREIERLRRSRERQATPEKTQTANIPPPKTPPAMSTGATKREALKESVRRRGAETSPHAVIWKAEGTSGGARAGIGGTRPQRITSVVSGGLPGPAPAREHADKLAADIRQLSAQIQRAKKKHDRQLVVKLTRARELLVLERRRVLGQIVPKPRRGKGGKSFGRMMVSRTTTSRARSAQPKRVRSVISGGLPTLGKRR
jgi:hypothetical protein